VASQTGRVRRMEKYVFSAKAVAAHFHSTTSDRHFGDEYTLTFQGETPGEKEKATDGRTGPEISFTYSSVRISCTKESGVYTTVVRSTLKNLNVKDVLTVDSIEAGVMTVYREEWYSDPARSKHARAIPLPPVIENLRVHGLPLRPGLELRLPEPFSFDEARRARYLNGEGTEIEPVGISSEPGRRITTPLGEIEFSADTRGIRVPDFGIVNIADWKWQPEDADTPSKSAHWVDLLRLELSNPGRFRAGGAGGNGTSYP
jgi:hypothetical protein